MITFYNILKSFIERVNKKSQGHITCPRNSSYKAPISLIKPPKGAVKPEICNLFKQFQSLIFTILISYVPLQMTEANIQKWVKKKLKGVPHSSEKFK